MCELFSASVCFGCYSCSELIRLLLESESVKENDVEDILRLYPIIRPSTAGSRACTMVMVRS